MNIYFLVEGEKTELIVYPQWLQYLLPKISRVNRVYEATENNYFLISGKGVPSIFDHLIDAIKTINGYPNDEFPKCHYEKLIVVIDADEMTVEEKIAEVKQFISNEKIVLNPKCELQIIAQKYCIETWFLGNRKVYPRNTDNVGFMNHAQHYDVSQQDPELMLNPNTFAGSTSIYHELYLRKMLAAKNINYSKSNPKEVGEKYYLEELNKRINETSHLSSLKNFFSFCESISI